MFSHIVPDCWVSGYSKIYRQQWPCHNHMYKVHGKLTERLIVSGAACGVCQPMSDVVECTWCKGCKEVVAKLEDNEVNYITQHPGFNSVEASMSMF